MHKSICQNILATQTAATAFAAIFINITLSASIWRSLPARMLSLSLSLSLPLYHCMAQHIHSFLLFRCFAVFCVPHLCYRFFALMLYPCAVVHLPHYIPVFMPLLLLLYFWCSYIFRAICPTLDRFVWPCDLLKAMLFTDCWGQVGDFTIKFKVFSFLYKVRLS